MRGLLTEVFFGTSIRTSVRGWPIPSVAARNPAVRVGVIAALP